jgi:hypothetical protein
VPLGLDPRESLVWAPAFYKAKFGIDVEVLPAALITADLIDQERQQADSERCIEHIRSPYPELDRYPSTLLSAGISQDIFIRNSDWAFTENYRGASDSPSSRPQGIVFFVVRLESYFNLPMSSDYTTSKAW